MLDGRPAAFAPMSADQIGAETAYEVKCLFAIDAIAAVYGADLRALQEWAHGQACWDLATRRTVLKREEI